MGKFGTQIREVINRNTVVTLALEQGFNAFLPVYDGGIDFILYREKDGALRKVQLKGRWMIARKYLDRDIWMAFPLRSKDQAEVWWHLMPHDLMVEHARADGKTLLSKSWMEGGAYSKPGATPALLAQCEPFRFAPIADVAREAATEAD